MTTAQENRTKLYIYREHQRAKGVQYPIDLVDATEAIATVQKARKYGITWAELERRTGLTSYALRKIFNSQVKRVKRSTRSQILRGLEDFDVAKPSPRTLVSVTPWHRQAVLSLIAQGWTAKHQAEIIRQNGRGKGTIIHAVTQRRRSLVLQENLDQIDWLVEVIGDREGPGMSKITMLKRGVFPLKHYTADGKLNVRTLSREQRRYVQ